MVYSILSLSRALINSAEGNGKVYAFALALLIHCAGSVDSNQISPFIYQRAAGIAVIDIYIHLKRVVAAPCRLSCAC